MEWLEPDNLMRIGGWARDGLTDQQIAKNMGVAYSTLREWKKKFPALSATLKESKEVVDREVENALLKRALGYKYTETRTKTENGAVTEVTTIEKEVVPDVTAQIFWLKNRKPMEWRDKRIIEDSSADKTEELLQNMQAISDILMHPAPDRNIEDLEGRERRE